MTRESVDRWCERTIVGLVLALMVVLPLFFGGRPQPAAGSVIDFLLGDPFLLVQWTAAAVLVLWLVRIWLDPAGRICIVVEDSIAVMFPSGAIPHQIATKMSGAELQANEPE